MSAIIETSGLSCIKKNEKDENNVKGNENIKDKGDENREMKDHDWVHWNRIIYVLPNILDAPNSNHTIV